MTTTSSFSEVDAYLDEVRARLSDLPLEERAELLDDITTHVRDVADEHGADQVRAKLGPPEQFADELRASAGYQTSPGQVAQAGQSDGRRWLPGTAIDRATLATHWKRLEPAWWLARGALVALVVMAGGDAGDAGNWSSMGAFYRDALFILAPAAVVSYLIGVRGAATPARWRRARAGLEIALALWGLLFVLEQVYAVTRPQTQVVFGAAHRDPCLRDGAQRPIGNLFAYDPTGKPIPQFFLVDQAGRPIDNLCPDQVPTLQNVQTQYARDANGSPVYNVFPRQQDQVVGIDPAAGTAAREPVSPPAVVLPQVQPAGEPSTAGPPAEGPPPTSPTGSSPTPGPSSPPPAG